MALWGLKTVLTSLPEAARAVGKHVGDGGLRESWKIRDTLSVSFLRELLRRGSLDDVEKVKEFIASAPAQPWPLGKVRASRVKIPSRTVTIRGDLALPKDTEPIDAQWVQYVGPEWHPEESWAALRRVRSFLGLEKTTRTKQASRSRSLEPHRTKSDPELFQRTTNEVDHAVGPAAEPPSSEPMVLCFHGGATIPCSSETHRWLSWRLARACGGTGRRCLMVNYGLAPEKPFPNGLRDAISAYLWLIEPEDGKAPRHDPRSIVLAGDSAGGNLVIALLLWLRDNKLPMPAGAILLSPWLDLTHSFPSYTLNSLYDILGAATSTASYYAPKELWSDPFVSPLYAPSFEGLPPLLITVGESEALRDESLIFALKFRERAIPTLEKDSAKPWLRAEIYEHQTHVFQMLHGPISRTSYDSMSKFIAFVTGSGEMEQGIFRVANKAPYKCVSASDAEVWKEVLEAFEKEEEALKKLEGKRVPERSRDEAVRELMEWLGVKAELD